MSIQKNFLTYHFSCAKIVLKALTKSALRQIRREKRRLVQAVGETSLSVASEPKGRKHFTPPAFLRDCFLRMQVEPFRIAA